MTVVKLKQPAELELADAAYDVDLWAAALNDTLEDMGTQTTERQDRSYEVALLISGRLRDLAASLKKKCCED